VTSKDLLKAARTILVIDWPSKELPEVLALAGFQVVVHSGPGQKIIPPMKLQTVKWSAAIPADGPSRLTLSIPIGP